MRQRTMPNLSDTEMHALYDRDWSVFVQQERDDATVEMGKTFEDIHSIADMSAGGASITPEIGAYHGTDPLLGDFGNVYGYRYHGTIQETVPQLPVVDLYVCSETLEHLHDPDADLALIRQHCRNLLLTTPLCQHEEDEHPAEEIRAPYDMHGHLWVWNRDDVEGMLAEAGFEIVDFRLVIFFGIWKCR